MKKSNLYSGLVVEDLQEITVDLSATVSDAADVLKEILKEWSPIIM